MTIAPTGINKDWGRSEKNLNANHLVSSTLLTFYLQGYKYSDTTYLPPNWLQISCSYANQRIVLLRLGSFYFPIFLSFLL